MLEEIVVVGRGAILGDDLHAHTIVVFGCRFHGDFIIAAARDAPQVTESAGSTQSTGKFMSEKLRLHPDPARNKRVL